MTITDIDPQTDNTVIHTGFGEALRDLRRDAGLTQEKLVEHVGRAFARSTVANIETGRERPSERFFQIIGEHFPEWQDRLRAPYERCRQLPETVGRPAPGRGRRELGGPYVIEHLHLVYVFRHSRAPEEIIATRRVRALESGCDGFGLKFQAESSEFVTEDEVLWGGRLQSSARYQNDGRTTYLQRVDFGKILQRGETHDFAVRRWVERDPDPDREALFCLSLPAVEVSMHIKFHGPERPRRISRVGPLADHCLVREPESSRAAVPVAPGAEVSEYFSAPELGSLYGVTWDW